MLALATAACGLGFERGEGVGRVAGSRRELAGLLGALQERGGAEAGAALQRWLDAVTVWKLRTRDLPLERSLVMGILNLTEDSFSGDGVGRGLGAALERAEQLREGGAEIIDIGAETARADRPVMEEGPEAALMAEAVTALVREAHLVSVDTYKAAVAKAALDSGAEIVNDISGLTQGTGAAEAAKVAGAGYVLNYSYSVPKRRPDQPPVYRDVVTETLGWTFERLAELERLGLGRERIATDPGIAFGKSHDEDLQMLRRLGEFASTGQPVLVAHSRKNFIGSVTGLPPGERDIETHAVSVLAFAQGARIFRVHDAQGTRRALDMAAAMLTAPAETFRPGGGSWPWREGASAEHMTREPADKPPPSGQRW